MQHKLLFIIKTAIPVFVFYKNLGFHIFAFHKLMILVLTPFYHENNNNKTQCKRLLSKNIVRIISGYKLATIQCILKVGDGKEEWFLKFKDLKDYGE